MKRVWYWLYMLSAKKLDTKSKSRPTVAELEKLLNSENDAQIIVLPDGSVTTL